MQQQFPDQYACFSDSKCLFRQQQVREGVKRGKDKQHL